MSLLAPVSFSPSGLVASSKPTNTFRLRGKGTVEVDAGRVVIAAKPSFRFGKPEPIAFSLEDIRNVVREGKLVRFEIPSLAGSPEASDAKKGTHPFVTVWTADEPAAVELARALGDAQTEAFAAEIREQGEFEQRLHAATPRAWVTPLLVGINALVFVAMAFDGAGVVATHGEVHVRWGSNYGLLTATGEWWRLFTSMFIHFGIIHLGLNMAALWDIGRIVERLFGNRTFLAMYLLSGIGGSVLSLLWHPAVNSAGASGAIFGVFGMLAGYLLHRDLGVPAAIMRRHWRITLPFIGYNLFIGATVPGIDNAAHLGGLAAGFAMGYALARPLERAARAFSRRRLAMLAAGLVALAAVVAKPLAAAGDEARIELDAREAISHAIEQDRVATQAVKDAVDKLRARQIGSEEAARRVDEEGRRRYQQAHDRLSSVALGEGSRQSDRRRILMRYTAMRAEGYGMLARSIRTDDEALANQALARIGESNAVAKEMEAARR